MKRWIDHFDQSPGDVGVAVLKLNSLLNGRVCANASTFTISFLSSDVVPTIDTVPLVDRSLQNFGDVICIDAFKLSDGVKASVVSVFGICSIEGNMSIFLGNQSSNAHAVNTLKLGGFTRIKL
jgi:hypothetical protein